MNEFSSAELGDERLTERLCKLAAQLAGQPGGSIPDATGDWGQACAAYRFLDNDQVSSGQILAAHRARTLDRLTGMPVALAVSDTTSLNYSQRAGTGGLGPIRTSRTKTYGLWQHSVLAFTPEGKALGVLDAQCWARDPARFGSRHRRKQNSIENKESYKWMQGFRALERVAAQTPQTKWVMIADREADIFDLFESAAEQAEGPALLVRAKHDRNRTDGERRLFRHLACAPVVGENQIQVPRRAQQAGRTATLTVRVREVHLAAPESKGSRPPLTLWAIEARELHPPKGVSPIHWRLLTTLRVTTLAEALEKLRWYCVRWQIEVFHRVLKSGCRVEAVQLREADRLKRYIVIKLVIAWRVMMLMKDGRERPEAALNGILEEHEWRALQAVEYKRQKYRGQKTPNSAPTLGEAMRWIAQLGGHLGRKGDGAPGPRSLARGLERLHDIVQGWKLVHEGK